MLKLDVINIKWINSKEETKLLKVPFIEYV